MHDSKPCWFKFSGNSRILQDFERFCWNFDQNPQNFRKIREFQSGLPSIYYKISNVVHGGVWIFSETAQ